MMNARAFKEACRNPYAWPGGYPTYLLMGDCEPICISCARKNAREILERIHSGLPSNCDQQWLPLAQEVNWEDPALICDSCYERIESAYAEDEAGEDHV